MKPPTKETAYLYLMDCGTIPLAGMSEYSKDFNIIDIFPEQNENGINYIIKCEYTDYFRISWHKLPKPVKISKHIHIDTIRFNEWIINNRQILINKILNI